MTTLIKLGGSLITDKRRAKSFRRTTVQDIARQLLELRTLQPDRLIVLGHGSGSFGHYEARKYNTISGLHSAEDRMGFARVGAVASELDGLILKELLAVGLPALRFQPSAMQIARDQALVHLDVRPLILALEKQFLPLVYGDVTLDETLGGTIISTESLFARLVEPLQVKNIILLGSVDGALDQDDQIIPHITADNFRRFEHLLGESDGYDVTGGMQQKVREMLDLVQFHQDLNVFIANGNYSNILYDLLVAGAEAGTRISAK